MAQVELQVRQLALSPSSYAGCSAAAGASSCRLSASLFTSLRATWVQVRDVRFDTVNQVFHAEIRSTHPTFEIKPRLLDIVVPGEVLTENSFTCPDAKPFFAGFDTDGSAICRALSAVACPFGTYVQSVNPSTLEPTCAPAGGPVSCPYGEQIASLKWTGGSNIAHTCVPRPAPPAVAMPPVPAPTAVPTAPPTATPAPTPSPTTSPTPLPTATPLPPPVGSCYSSNVMIMPGSYVNIHACWSRRPDGSVVPIGFCCSAPVNGGCNGTNPACP